MPRVPDTAPARNVLASLRDQLQDALDDPPSPERCRELLRSMNEVGQLGVWCRDAAIELGRRTTPQLTFAEMQTITGVPDATLHDRYRRWSDKEG